MSEIGGFTTLKIFNVHGQEIATLKNQFAPKGKYSVEFDGSRYSPGIYYYQLKIDNYMLTKKCIIM